MAKKTSTTGGVEKPDDPGRQRLIIDTTEEIHQAVQLRATQEGVRRRRRVTHSEVVNEILTKALGKELAQVRELMASPDADQGDDPPPSPRPRRGG